MTLRKLSFMGLFIAMMNILVITQGHALSVLAPEEVAELGWSPHDPESEMIFLEPNSNESLPLRSQMRAQTLQQAQQRAKGMLPQKQRLLMEISFGAFDNKEGASPLIRAFVNAPDATVETPGTDPRFLGVVSFFTLPEGEETRLIFDLGRTLTNMEQAGLAVDPDDINVNLVYATARKSRQENEADQESVNVVIPVTSWTIRRQAVPVSKP